MLFDSRQQTLSSGSTTPPAGPGDVDIIGYERIQVALDDDIHSAAEAVLSNALDSADYGEAGERTVYGNPAGLGLLEERYDLKQRMKRLEDKQEKSDARITDLEHRVKTLTLASEGYRKIRHRFLEVYRRDILDDVNKEGRKKIDEGNEAAHEGDAITDASLYISAERRDETVLVDLYGLTANQISFLSQAGDLDSISTLNAGATWRANGLSKIPPDVDAAFKTFVKELNLNLGKSPTDGITSLSKAYYAFWTAHNKHK